MYIAISARKRSLPQPESGETEPKHTAPELDTCHLFVRTISPCRSILLGSHYDATFSSATKGASMSPSSSTLPAITWFSSKPFTLSELHVSTMSDHLPGLCQAECNNEQYSCKDDVFRLTTPGRYRAARLYLDKQYTNFKFSELRFLLNVVHVVQNQQTMYILALPDVMTYATVELSSPSCCTNTQC